MRYITRYSKRNWDVTHYITRYRKSNNITYFVTCYPQLWLSFIHSTSHITCNVTTFSLVYYSSSLMTHPKQCFFMQGLYMLCDIHDVTLMTTYVNLKSHAKPPLV